MFRKVWKQGKSSIVRQDDWPKRDLFVASSFEAVTAICLVLKASKRCDIIRGDCSKNDFYISKKSNSGRYTLLYSGEKQKKHYSHNYENSNICEDTGKFYSLLELFIATTRNFIPQLAIWFGFLAVLLNLV